jgi:hypothetical protein
MVLKNTESTIAYRCPHCGSGILAMVGVFALSGDMIKLKCDCGHSELLIQKCGDGKIRLTVPCMFCPKPHQYVLSHAAFFDQSIYSIPCGMTGVDICFIGHKDEVLEALRKSRLPGKDLLVDGRRYQRMKPPEGMALPLALLYPMKEMFIQRVNVPFGKVYTPEILEMVRKDFVRLKPMYKLLCSVADEANATLDP